MAHYLLIHLLLISTFLKASKNFFLFKVDPSYPFDEREECPLPSNCEWWPCSLKVAWPTLEFLKVQTISHHFAGLGYAA